MPEIANTDLLFGDAAVSAVPEFAAAPATLAAVAFTFMNAFRDVLETALIHAIRGVSDTGRLVHESPALILLE